MAETVLITGASGLLGRALVGEFAGEGLRVLAQYRRHKGMAHKNVRWLAGDFSSVNGTATFLKRHQVILSGCHHVVHNYGPIVEKATANVTGADLLNAFQGNVRVALEITRFLLAHAPLRSALFIAFEDTGRLRPYKKILAFAMAKNSLLWLGRSLAAVHPGVRFNVFSPPTMAGSAIRHPEMSPVAPEKVAKKIRRIMKGRGTGRHYRWKAVSAGKKAQRRRHGYG